MGILNCTPDSFSDGGRYTDLDACLKQAELLVAFGGENGNYDIIPLATIEMEDTEDLLKIEVANKIWDIAKISPEHGNALMDLLGTEVYEKISMIQTSNSKKEE